MKRLKIVSPRKESPDEIIVESSRLVEVGPETGYGYNTHPVLHIDNGKFAIQSRGCGIFKDHGFYLSDDFDWVLGKDDQNMIVLVPLKKTNDC